MGSPDSSALSRSAQLDDAKFLSSVPSDSPASRFSWSARAVLAALSNLSVCTAYGHLAQVATVAWLNTGPRSWAPLQCAWRPWFGDPFWGHTQMVPQVWKWQAEPHFFARRSSFSMMRSAATT